jgi:hypothetical protein
MIYSTHAAPAYALAFIEDPSGGELPDVTTGALVVSTQSCITVGCKPDADGETEFRLGPADEVDPGRQPIFRERLATPSRKIVVRSALGETFLEAPVPEQRTMIYIWVNDPIEPDQIIIGVG